MDNEIPVCEPSKIDTTIFEGVTSPNYNPESFNTFLCEVLKFVGVDNIDPILFSAERELTVEDFYTPEKGVNFQNLYIDIEGMSNIGDPRSSLGYVLSSTLSFFFPIALTQLEVKRNGGCQVIENYICDSNGNKIKKLETICPENYTPEPITANAIVEKSAEVFRQKIDEHAQSFVDHLNAERANGWDVSLHKYTDFPFFYAKLQKDGNSKYIKYYPDAQNIVSEKIGLDVEIRNDNSYDDENHFLSMSSPVTFPEESSYTFSFPDLFSGDYNDLTNKPELFSGNYEDLSGKPILFSGDYNDLINKPSIEAFSFDYNDLINKPVIFSGNYEDLSGKPDLFSGNYNDLTNKPVLFTGDYNDLINKPIINNFSGDYNDLTNKPILFNGDYNSLSNLPLLGTAAFENTGTIGNTIPKNNTANVFSGTITFQNPLSSGNIMQFSVNGAERMRIDNNGNVGIGTTNPEFSFQAEGTTAETSTVAVFRTANDGNAPTFQSVKARGTPSAKTAAQNGDQIFRLLAGAQYDANNYRNTAGIFFRATQNQTSANGGSAFTIETTQNNTVSRVERMRVDNNGNVGIGTTAPAEKLDVTGNVVIDNGANFAYLLLKRGGNEIGRVTNGSNNLTFQSRNNNAIDFTNTTGTVNARILDNGDCAFGTTTFTRTFNFTKTQNGHTYIRVENTNSGEHSFVGLEAQSNNTRCYLISHASGRTVTRYGVSLSNASEILTNQGEKLLIGSTISMPIIFGTSNVERMRITSAGNIGINTTSPSERLHVVGNGLFTGSLSAQNLASAATRSVPSSGNASATEVVLGNDTRLTDSRTPTSHTHTLSEITDAGTAASRNTGTSGSTVPLLDTVNNWTGRQDFNSGASLSPPSDIWATSNQLHIANIGCFYHHGSFRTSINSNGYRNNSSQWVSLSANSQTGAAQIELDPSGFIAFRSDAVKATGSSFTVTERVRITNAGALCVGQTAPLALNVGTEAGASFAPDGVIAGSRSGTVLFLRRMGTDGEIVQFRRDTTVVGNITIDTTSTSYNTSSDYRLKENISEIPNSIQIVKALKPVEFNFIAEPTKRVSGFIAHEVAELIPNAVSGKKDEYDSEGPKYQGLDHSKIVPILTDALQKALLKIEELETTIQQMNERINILETL